MAQILPLSGHHDKPSFDCGNPVLNIWLSNMASQHRRKGISTTYVAAESSESTRIFGYYALSIAELRAPDTPQDWQKKLPGRVPVFRLGRLAVDLKHQNTGLGRLLLANAISRVVRLQSEVGGVGVIVDAKPEAVGFYQGYGFEQLADHPGVLFLALSR